MPQTWLEFITDAIIEMGAYGPGDTIPDPVWTVCVNRLNYILNKYAALKRYAYNVNFTVYTLTPNHSPTLLGPGLTAPDWATLNGGARPPRLEGANLVLNNTNPSTDLIIRVRDDAWWLGNQVKSITSTVPTDVYYSPDFPNGALYFWPIPTVAYDVRLEVWVVVGEVDPDTLGTTQIVVPQAYKQMMMLELAKAICRPLSRAVPQSLIDDLREARAAVQSNNISSPRIASADYGTGLGGGRGDFNYRSGTLPS